jgi:hypothetical protein
MYLEVPIVGSGTVNDKYRPRLSAPKSAVIPCDLKTGKPLHTMALVWVADKYDAEVDRAITRIPLAQGRNLVAQLNPKANVDRLEQKPRDVRGRPSLGPLIPGLLAARAPISRRTLLLGAGLAAGSMLLPRRADAALVFTSQATDNFNRANGGLGANWDDGYSGYIAAAVVSNQVRPSAAASIAVESYNAITWPNDQYSQFKLVNWFNENLAGVILRAAAPSTETFYIANTSEFGGSTFTNELAKSIAGSWTTLADDTAISAWSNVDTLKGAVYSTDLYLYKTGVQALTATDSDLTSGRGGIMELYFAGGAGGQVDIDNWEGGEVTDDSVVSGSGPKTRMLTGVGQ